MTSKNKHKALQSKGVDCGLVAMFLKMNPEERIMANDNSLRVIWELRDAFTQRKKQTSSVGSERSLEALSKADIDFIVVGGLAAVAQRSPITTMDIDIVHRQSKDNIEKLLAFLKKVDAIHRRPDDKILEPKISDLSGRGHALICDTLRPIGHIRLYQGRARLR